MRAQHRVHATLYHEGWYEMVGKKRSKAKPALKWTVKKVKVIIRFDRGKLYQQQIRIMF